MGYERECQSEGYEFPLQLCEKFWGEVKEIEEECPGVFYIITSVEESVLCREIYAVTRKAIPDIISKEAVRYGKEQDGIYFFECGIEGSGFELVKYELLRYRTRHNLPLEAGDTLYSYAVFCMDKYPKYFGNFIPPRSTPWGMTIRYKRAAEGVFFLETDRCVWVLALSYSVWSICLSDFAQKLGVTSEHEKSMLPEEARYLYFERNTCAPALYELLDAEECRGILDYVTSREVLEAHLCTYFPQYVMWHNLIEQSGWGKEDWIYKLHDLGAGINLDEILDREEESDTLIHYNPALSREKLLLLP